MPVLSSRTTEAAITGAVTVATVGPLLVPEPRAWWIVALGFLASAPVWWRRRAPMATGLLVGAAMTVMVMWEKPFLPFGPLVAVYTVAELSPLRVRMAAVPIVAATVGVSLALPAEDDQTVRLIGTAFVAAYALGTSARARHSRLAELAERARRLEQEHIAAVAGERTRIARDMHDIVTHSVGLMVVQAEAGPLDPVRAEAAFEAIAETGRGALVELRGLLAALRSAGGDLVEPRLDGLPGLLERTGLETTLTVEGDPRPITGGVEAAAYRIVQEALTNVLKHAGTPAVHVRVRWGEQGLEVEIADGGGGPSGHSGGYGLAGMRERAAACGGTLHAGSGDNGGFVVRAAFPV
ncbi:sensor histidine kinase [Nonomuraea sp. NPDC050383]|uniref:sensor histidine kinase n=1 Tax=Nonomuraea sp. NPDC050383 TaxID=3364362 RepID=UPI00379154D6